MKTSVNEAVRKLNIIRRKYHGKTPQRAEYDGWSDAYRYHKRFNNFDEGRMDKIAAKTEREKNNTLHPELLQLLKRKQKTNRVKKPVRYVSKRGIELMEKRGYNQASSNGKLEFCESRAKFLVDGLHSMKTSAKKVKMVNPETGKLRWNVFYKNNFKK